MPPKRTTNGGDSKPRKKRRMPPKETPEYKERRDRNNESVKKSREKAKEKANGTMEKVRRLRDENRELEQQVEILSKELILLKDLFKSIHAGSLDGHCAVSATEVGSQTDAAGASNATVNLHAVEKDHEYSSKT